MSNILDEVVRMDQEANGKYEGTEEFTCDPNAGRLTLTHRLVIAAICILHGSTLVGFGYLVWIICKRVWNEY